MKKISLLLVAVLTIALLATAGQPVLAMDADELIAKIIEASGGKDKITAVKSRKSTGKFMAMGMEFPFTVQQLSPDKIIIESEVQGAKLIQAYDGTVGWMVNPMMGSNDPQRMPPMQEKGFKLQADMNGPLIDWKEKGYTVEYVGTEDVEGTETHQLKVDTQDGIVMDMYVDSEYFLPIKIHSKVVDGEAEYESDTYLSDYKEVEGLMEAHAIETKMNGQTMNQIMVETLELNVEVDPAIFTMPEETKAEPGGAKE